VLSKEEGTLSAMRPVLSEGKYRRDQRETAKNSNRSLILYKDCIELDVLQSQ